MHLLFWLHQNNRGVLTPPSVPTGLVATPGDSQVLLTWTPNSDVDTATYRLYRNVNGGAYSAIGPGPLGLATAYLDTGLTNGLVHGYKIAARDDLGNESAQSSVVTAVPRALPIVSIYSANFGTAERFLWIMGDELPLSIAGIWETEGRWSAATDADGLAQVSLYSTAAIQASGGVLGTYRLIPIDHMGKPITTYCGITIPTHDAFARLVGGAVVVMAGRT